MFGSSFKRLLRNKVTMQFLLTDLAPIFGITDHKVNTVKLVEYYRQMFKTLNK